MQDCYAHASSCLEDRDLSWLESRYLLWDEQMSLPSPCAQRNQCGVLIKGWEFVPQVTGGAESSVWLRNLPSRPAAYSLLCPSTDTVNLPRSHFQMCSSNPQWWGFYWSWDFYLLLLLASSQEARASKTQVYWALLLAQDTDSPTVVIPAYLLCHPWLHGHCGASLELPHFDLSCSKLSSFLHGCAARSLVRDQVQLVQGFVNGLCLAQTLFFSIRGS